VEFQSLESKKQRRSSLPKEVGGNLIEYAILVSLITVACFAAVQGLSNAQSAKLGSATQSLVATN
jgi:Flp pilus assembly pilin Flp